MKRWIFPNDFAPYYPAGIKPCPMYVDVANRMYDRIKEFNIALPYADDLKKEIAINVAIYFEDKISGIGLWNAFVIRHMAAYLRPLPFFDDFDELEDDDVCAKEVELLIWLVISRNFEDRFLNPLALGENIANIIMDVLTEDDEVEINQGLYDFVYNQDKANDYFKLKHVLIWLRRSYLLYSPLEEDLIDKLTDRYSQQFKKSEAEYYAETTFCTTTEIGPMALAPHLWLAEMYKNKGMLEEAKKLKNVKYCQQDTFVVVEADASYAILKNSKDEEYKLKNVYPDLLRKDAYVFTSLVLYGDNDWEINGVVFKTSKRSYDNMRRRQEELKESYEYSYPIYMERTNGKRMAFFENISQLKDWLQKVATEIDVAEICNQLPGGPQVAFISKKAGIIFAPGIIHAIKCEYNPFYQKCDARTMQKETADAVLNIEAMHPELLQYLLENEMLQDGDISSQLLCEAGNEIFTLNIDFIARNHRRQYYHDHDY
ncbi:MAG: DUF3843 family protein [Prevotella sp.]